MPAFSKNLFFCLILFWVSSERSYAQTVYSVDSMLVRAKLYLENYQPAKAQVLAESAVKRAVELSFAAQEFQGLVILGDASRAKREYQKAIGYYTRAISVAESLESFNGLIVNERLGDLYMEWGLPEKSLDHYDFVLNRTETKSSEWLLVRKKLANAYVRLGEKQWAIDMYYEVLEGEERLGDNSAMLATLKSLASLNLQIGNTSDALSNNLEILDIQKRTFNKEGSAIAMNSIGSLYKSQNKYDKALEYYFEALAINRSIGNHSSQISNQINIAGIYQAEGNQKKALNVLNQALEDVKAYGSQIELAVMYNYLSSVYLALNDKSKALELNENAVRLLKNSNNKSLLANTYLKMSETYESLGREKAALEFFKNYTNLKDSIYYREQLAKERQNMKQLIAETTERESKLAIVDQEMRSLELAKANSEAEQARQSAELELRETQLQNADLRNKQLQNDRQMQRLLFSQQQAEALEKDREILLLEQERKLQESQLEQNRLEDIDQNRELELQRSRIALQNSQIDAGKNRQLFILAVALSLFLIMVLLLVLFFIKRSDNRKLIAHNEAIEKQKAEIERINENLIELNEEKNDLISIVAHDLKSPLNQIAGIIEIVKLTSGDLSKEMSDYMETVDRSISRMKTMVTQILDVNAIENKPLQPEFERVDAQSILTEMIMDFRTLAERKNISIVSEIPQLPAVKADKHFLMEIFQNLLSNAIKYSPLWETVRVKAVSTDVTVRVEFSDNGEGISEDDMKRLFGKFHRLSARPTAGEDSTGLGLSIVKRYVDAMKGRVWCESKVGEGSTFIVELPVA